MCTYDVHDAVKDCKYLKKIIEHNSKCIEQYKTDGKYKTQFTIIDALDPGKVVSDSILKKKTSSSGLSIHNLQL